MPPGPLTIATGPADATRARYDGSVGIDGPRTMRTGRTLAEIFERMMRQHDFDVAELGWRSTRAASRPSARLTGPRRCSPTGSSGTRASASLARRLAVICGKR